VRKEFAAGYGQLEEWHWWFRGRQRILETVLRRTLPGNGPLAIASLGCGPAEGLRWLAPFARGAPVVGTDVEREHARRLAPRIEYVLARAEAAPFASERFDVVLALDVLEHLDDDAAGLREAARLVRPGGSLIVTVPALPSLWGSQDTVSHHRRRYTRASLLDAYGRARLPVPRVTYFNSLLFPPIAAVRWTRRLLGLTERARSDFEDSQPGLVNDLLGRTFALERHLVPRFRLPVGVSLLGVSRIRSQASVHRDASAVPTR